MLKCIIIDDELKSIKSFVWELKAFEEEVNVLETFTNPSEAISYLQGVEVDFIFLDIEMPQMDGFEFLEQFPDRPFDVVFVTAYDEYAINAIKQNAADYLLKPVDKKDLEFTIEKLQALKKNQKLKYQKPGKTYERISIPLEKKMLFLDPRTILYCESEGNYSHIFLKEGKKYMVSRKLKYFEDILPDEYFFRVHNSYLINLAEVREFNRANACLRLSNAKTIPVSRTRKSLFLERI